MCSLHGCMWVHLGEQDFGEAAWSWAGCTSWLGNTNFYPAAGLVRQAAVCPSTDDWCPPSCVFPSPLSPPFLPSLTLWVPQANASESELVSAMQACWSNDATNANPDTAKSLFLPHEASIPDALFTTVYQAMERLVPRSSCPLGLGMTVGCGPSWSHMALFFCWEGAAAGVGGALVFGFPFHLVQEVCVC
jgi:hypothetical protein